MSGSFGALDTLPRVDLAHVPTPIERMPNLAAALDCAAELYVKRDDCTGLAFGGNKTRQLEYYFGEAARLGADVALITGAVQSNFVRQAAAAARKLGMDCHVQLESRVPRNDATYETSGNVLLDYLLGATVHTYPEGEDEAGADRQLQVLAEELRRSGRRPYVIPLGPGHPPLGALGYVRMARELLQQAEGIGISFDEIVVASGSGATHAGLLFGLRAGGSTAHVTGVCVRREAAAQADRIAHHCDAIATLLGCRNPVTADDIVVTGHFLAPGYGRMGADAERALLLAARTEGLLLDPVYTAKAMAGFAELARNETARGRSLLFVHTGGQPALFAYQSDLEQLR